MSQRYEVRISGTGGQGVVLAAIIMAEAAAAGRKGQKVVQTVHYGPQVRGGLSNAELVISNKDIDYPLPIGLDLVIPFTEQAMDESAPLMKENCVIIYDPALVPKVREGWAAPIPLTQLAIDTTGRKQMANIVSLGAALVFCPHLNAAGFTFALQARAPQGLAEAFSKAAAVGEKAARKIKGHLRFAATPSPED